MMVLFTNLFGCCWARQLPKLIRSRSRFFSLLFTCIFRHLKIHLGDKIDVDKEAWNPDKEIFHYFSMHDLNKDDVIDGLEVINAVTHDHEGNIPKLFKLV